MTGVTGINDTEQEPRSLREIAKDLDRPREKLDPLDRYPQETEHGDRILTPDEDGYRPEIEPPRYKNERELYEARQTEREEADEQQHAANERYLDQDEQEHKARVNNTAGWNSDEERQWRSALEADTIKLNQDAARQLVLERGASAEIASLRAAGQFAAAAIIEGQVKALRAPIFEKREELVRRTEQTVRYDAAKQKAALQQEAMRVCPGIAFGDTLQRFKRYLQREHRIPLADIEAETRPQMFSAFYKLFQEHETEAYNKLARKRIASERDIVTRGAGSSTSSKDAREALKSRGKMDDALAFLDLKRRERRYGL